MWWEVLRMRRIKCERERQGVFFSGRCAWYCDGDGDGECEGCYWDDDDNSDSGITRIRYD